jgi:acyl transferase domain-containing protein
MLLGSYHSRRPWPWPSSEADLPLSCGLSRPRTDANAVGCVDVSTAKELLEHTADVGRACIAAINSPGNVNLSGDVAAIDAMERIANAQGIFNRRLRVNVTYHSHHMELVAESYFAAIGPYCTAQRESTTVGSGRLQEVSFFSSVTGQIAGAGSVSSAQYWVKNLVNPVRFSEAITLATNQSTANVLVEFGPHAALKGLINQIVESLEPKQRKSMTYVPSLVRGTNDAKAVLQLAGRLFAMGLNLDFSTINGTEPKYHRVLIDLPSYEWDKKARFIHKSPLSVGKFHSGHTFTLLLGWKMASQGREHVFRQVFTLDELPWIRDHKIVGDVLFPFTGFLSLAVDAFRSITNAATSFVVREMYIERGLPIKEEQRVDICTKLRDAETGTCHVSSSIWTFEVMTWTEQTEWTTHAHGRIEAGTEGKDLGASESPEWQDAKRILQGVKACDLTEATALAGYESLDRSGMCYGPSFRNSFEMWRAPGKTVYRIHLRQTDVQKALSIPERGSPTTVDPPMLDSMLSAALLAIGDGLPEPRPSFVPSYVRRLQVSNLIPSTPGQTFTIVCDRKTFEEKTGRSDVSIVAWADSPQDPNDRLPCLMMELTFQRVNDAGADCEDELKHDLPRGYYEVVVPHVELCDNMLLTESLMDRS